MAVELYDFHKVTGASHKEVGVGEIVDDALNRGLEGIVVISSGNFLHAIKEEIERRSVDLTLFNLTNCRSDDPLDVPIPKDKIVRTPEERVALVKDQRGLDLNVDDYTDFIPQAYSDHSRQMLVSHPDYIICPIGSGKLWKTIVDVIEVQGLPTRVIGVAPRKGNPFYRQNEFTSSVADKLTAPYIALTDEILSRAPKHVVVEASETQLKKAYSKAREQGIECEVSGAAAFVFYDDHFRKRNSIDLDDAVVLVSTGRGMAETIKSMERRSLFRKLGALSSLVSLGFGMALLAAGYVHQANGVSLKNSVPYLAHDEFGRTALEYVLNGRKISQLTDRDIEDAFIISGMGSNGLDYRVYSQRPETRAMYEDFALRCKVHQGCEFNPEVKKQTIHLGTIKYKSG